jgi:glycosyltransferase involved in cell wall biosynthesis
MACYVAQGHEPLATEGGNIAARSKTRRLRMGRHVRFVDRFVGRVELTRWLEAADVFVTPYPNLDQIVSGTLSYAMGAGRAIVSTPYAYAEDLLGGGRGVLVPPGSPAAWADALIGLLENDVLRAAVGRRAHEHSRGMVWSSVGTQYRQLFARVVAGTRMQARPLPLLAAHG